MVTLELLGSENIMRHNLFKHSEIKPLAEIYMHISNYVFVIFISCVKHNEHFRPDISFLKMETYLLDLVRRLLFIYFPQSSMMHILPCSATVEVLLHI